MNWKQSFPEVFSDGLVTCTKAKAKFELKKNATPTFKLKRRVPFVSLDPINKELDRIKKIDLISKIDYSEWASPTVYVKKMNNKIRIYADFSTGLKESLMQHNYTLKSPDEIFAKLNGRNFFSKRRLSKSPSEQWFLKTINIHRGSYKFNRLPFGINLAPRIFQQIMDTVLAGLHCDQAYLNDEIIKR